MKVYPDDHPIFDAVESNNYSAVEKFLSEGVKPNARGEGRISLSYTVANEGLGDVLRLLLEYGLDPNEVQPATGETLIFRLINKRRFEMVRLLVDQGANVNHSDRGGRTPLMFASSIGDLGFFNYLRNCGADLNATTDWGENLLFFCRSADIAKILLDFGVDPTAVIRRGRRTALVNAAMAGETNAPGVCRILLEHGADPNHLDIRKMSVLDCAADQETRAVIKEFGGKSASELLQP